MECIYVTMGEILIRKIEHGENKPAETDSETGYYTDTIHL